MTIIWYKWAQKAAPGYTHWHSKEILPQVCYCKCLWVDLRYVCAVAARRVFYVCSFHIWGCLTDCWCVCVSVRVWCCVFRVRWPASAGHAEPHGEEEAGVHPRADRHRGELRQRPAARHGGKHTGSPPSSILHPPDFIWVSISKHVSVCKMYLDTRGAWAEGCTYQRDVAHSWNIRRLHKEWFM